MTTAAAAKIVSQNSVVMIPGRASVSPPTRPSPEPVFRCLPSLSPHSDFLGHTTLGCAGRLLPIASRAANQTAPHRRAPAPVEVGRDEVERVELRTREP